MSTDEILAARHEGHRYEDYFVYAAFKCDMAVRIRQRAWMLARLRKAAAAAAA